MEFRPPRDTHRHTVIGRTGSGKTQSALWSLANRSLDKQPWVLLDFKRDELIGEIPLTHELELEDKIPKEPGLYIARPTPGEPDAEKVEQLLWRIHAKGQTGLFLDEGYMIPQHSPAFQAILTQGRSKRIPLITLTQRPAWVTRFAFSEAEFIQLFSLTDAEDLKRVRGFMKDMPIEKRIPQYHSWWYDSPRDYRALLSPAPDEEAILDAFYDRLKIRKGVF